MGMRCDIAPMAIIPHPDETLPLSPAAKSLRVPVGWLRAEVEAGRLPALIAGRSILIHVPTVAELLKARAKQGEGAANDG